MALRQNQESGFYETGKVTFTEVEGFFANLLFSELLKRYKYLKKDSHLYDKRELITNATYTTDTFIVTSAFNKFRTYDSFDYDSLCNYLFGYGIDAYINDSNFLGFMNENLDTDVNYGFSYLTALDLYNLYKEDPEKVIRKVLLVPSLLGKDIPSDLKILGATFHEDGYKNLNEHCKRLLKTKTN